MYIGIVHCVHLTERVTNLLIVLTVHNGLSTDIYRYANSRVAASCQKKKKKKKKRTIHFGFLLNQYFGIWDMELS